MTVVLVWNTDDDGPVVSEYVYYDPDDILACGWAA